MLHAWAATSQEFDRLLRGPWAGVQGCSNPNCRRSRQAVGHFAVSSEVHDHTRTQRTDSNDALDDGIEFFRDRVFGVILFLSNIIGTQFGR